MSRRFISLVLATATAIAVSAAQVPAQQTYPTNTYRSGPTGAELATILGGLALLWALVEAAEDDDEDKKKKKKKKAHAEPSQRHAYAPYHGRSKTLPGRCLRLVETVRGETRRAFLRRCLARENVQVARLPDRCAFTADTRRGVGVAYGARCLRREGYSVR